MRDGDVEEWLDSLVVSPGDARDGRHMRRIAAGVAAIAAAEAEVAAGVAAAREAGDSWSMIGLALGTSKQAAFQRFGRLAP